VRVPDPGVRPDGGRGAGQLRGRAPARRQAREVCVRGAPAACARTPAPGLRAGLSLPGAGALGRTRTALPTCRGRALTAPRAARSCTGGTTCGRRSCASRCRSRRWAARRRGRRRPARRARRTAGWARRARTPGSSSCTGRAGPGACAARRRCRWPAARRTRARPTRAACAARPPAGAPGGTAAPRCAPRRFLLVLSARGARALLRLPPAASPCAQRARLAAVCKPGRPGLFRPGGGARSAEQRCRPER